MNTSGLLQIKLNLLPIFTFYYKYLNIEIIYNFENKTDLYLICNFINGFVGVQNGKAEHPD